MQYAELFTYQWSFEDADEGHIINMYGLTKANEDVLVRVTGFKPWVYVEVPDGVSERAAELAVRTVYKDKKISVAEVKPVLKEKLYSADVSVQADGSVRYRRYTFLQVFFNRNDGRRNLMYALGSGVSIGGTAKLSMKVHEHNASPVLQFTSMSHLPTAGWVRVGGTVCDGVAKTSVCAHELTCSYLRVVPLTEGGVVRPLILSMDIEANSSVPTRMPTATEPHDRVMMVSCIVSRQGAPESTWDKILLTLGEPDPDKVGEDVEVRYFTDEGDLLIGYAELVMEKNPQVIIGFNIFGFDFPFMINRAKSEYTRVINQFKRQGVVLGRLGKEQTIKWSSSAFKTQEFTYLDFEGRLFIDLYPMVQREFKLDSYNLKSVTTYFLGETKDPLTPKGIFKCFRLNTPSALGVVGKYCVQDSVLVTKLFERLNVWAWVTEKANVCNVPIFTLYSAGQQITVFSQVYKKCLHDGIVVESSGHEPREGESYSGAYVFPPKPGLYDNVTSFDFSSLYPTTIIAYNIDYHTLVTDPKIPDSMCHVIEWEDHIGCEHDTTVRKTKVKTVMCDRAPKRYRFLKEPKGVLPTILFNLLDARKRVNRMMEERKETLKSTTDEAERARLASEITVLDKRQLSLKVSANSMYGAMGVSRGYLPFMPGAMCTTARGRQSIEKAAKFIQSQYKGQLIYGDTDSCYVHFTHTDNPDELYQFCERVEEEMTALFPKPMKLAFEGKIYWRFFILTKKRYMALTCDRTGKVASKPFSRGVILSRRDNSACVRNLYQDTIMSIFYRRPESYVLSVVFDGLTRLFQRAAPLKDFTVTKSVGDIDSYAIKLPTCVGGDKEKRKAVGKMRAEKVAQALGQPVAEHDCAECAVNGVDANCGCERTQCLGCYQESQYKLTVVPPQVQLAERMRRRGKPVQAGSRIEFVVTLPQTYTAKKHSSKGWVLGKAEEQKLAEKMEDLEYYRDHAETLQLDIYYYLKFAVNPFDQMLEVAYGTPDVVGSFYKHMRNRLKLMAELRLAIRPELVFED